MCGWPVILFHAYTLHADEYLEEDSDDDFTYEEVGLTDWMHPMIVLVTEYPPPPNVSRLQWMMQ